MSGYDRTYLVDGLLFHAQFGDDHHKYGAVLHYDVLMIVFMYANTEK